MNQHEKIGFMQRFLKFKRALEKYSLQDQEIEQRKVSLSQWKVIFFRSKIFQVIYSDFIVVELWRRRRKSTKSESVQRKHSRKRRISHKETYLSIFTHREAIRCIDGQLIFLSIVSFWGRVSFISWFLILGQECWKTNAYLQYLTTLKSQP